MSKKKRVKRDIEKLYRGGRYWDMLRLMESEGMASESAREHQEAWKTLIKKALQQERAFSEFCAQVETVKSLPRNNPDFRLLVGLKDYIDGRASAEEVFELKGLNPDAQRLRSGFAAFAASAVQPGKLRSPLARFVREPDKITRRFYEQIADLLPGSAAASVSRLGELIPLARRFNQKAAISRGWAGVDLRSLDMLDRKLERISKDLPPALRDILLYPFVCNIAVLYRRLAPETGSNRAAQLVRAIPFLLPALAGERADDVRSKLVMGSGEWTAGSDSDFLSMEPKIEGLSIEEKIILLGSLRIKVEERRSSERGRVLHHFFDDDYYVDDEERLSRRERKARAKDLARMLLLLYRNILRDISGRQAAMPLRDKKELVRVMEPVLLSDIDIIADAMDGPDELQRLLDAAIESGAAGVRLGLLAFLVGSHYRNVDLRKHAEKLLDQTQSPAPQDMEWLAREWSELYYPHARWLRSLLARYKGESDLLAVFAAQLCTMMEEDLIEDELRGRLWRSPSYLMGAMGMSSVVREDFLTLGSELDELSEYEVLDSPRHFLRCFSDGHLSTEKHLCWLEALRSMRGEAVWEYVLAELKRSRSLDAEDPMDLSPREMLLRELYKDKAGALRLFMKEHLDELASISAATIEPLLDELLEHSTAQQVEPALLIRMEKLLAERLESGEESVRPLMDRLRQTIQKLARPKKGKAPANRRSKR